MMYTCSICDYKTTRAYDYNRHMKRIIPCKSKHDANTLENGANADLQKVNVDLQKVNADLQKVNADLQKVNVDQQICVKCGKTLSTTYRLHAHVSRCDGLDKKQCKICLKLFATKQGKSQHIRYVKCNPPHHCTTINNTTINDNSTNIHITNKNNYITNNIRLCFGNEDVSKICDEASYMKRMEDCVKMLKYAIPMSVEGVFFNDNYPENQTVKKDRRNDDLINVHIGDGKWENRLATDTMDTFINTIQNYMEKYIDTVKLNPVVRSRLKAFGKEMSKFKEWSTESIEDRLDIEPYDDVDEDEMKKNTKSICKLLKAKIYEETRNKLDA